MNRPLLNGATLLASLLLLLLVAREGCPFSGTEKGYKKITKEELKVLLDTPGVFIIDVRSDRDWNSSDERIRGAIREDPYDGEKWAGKYPKDATIVLYCA